MTSRRALHGWLVADAVSLVGTRVSMIALPWFVLVTTGSATRTGLVALAEMLPLVLCKVLGGPVIDRLGARRVAIVCDAGSLVVVGTIPLLYDAGHLSFPGFLALVAVAGALRGPGDGAKEALVPLVAAQARVPLERVTGLASAVERTSSMLGAAGAGLLIAAVGPANAVVVDALSFGVSGLVLWWSTRALSPAAARPAYDAEAGPADLAPQPDPTPQPDPAPREPYLRQLHEGWRFLRHDPVLLGIAVMVSLTNLLDLAWASVLMPVWARETGGGAAVIGAVFAIWGGASAVGSLCAAAWATRLSRYRTYLVAFLVTGLPRFVVLALDSPLWLVLATCVVGGFASGFLNPVLGAVTFERIPDRLVGRVTSLTTAMCFALMPLGGLLGGVLVTGFGLSAAMLAVGVAYFAVTMLPALDPRWRELDDRPEPAAREEAQATSRA